MRVTPKNNGRRGGSTAALAAIAIFFATSEARAFCRTHTCEGEGGEDCVLNNGCPVGGPLAFWPSACLTYTIQSAGSPKLGLSAEQVEVVLAQEFGRWSEASCERGLPAFRAQSRGIVQCDQVEYNCEHDNVNVVMFRDQEWPYDSTNLALTTASTNMVTGEILDADMEVNTALYDFRLDSPAVGPATATDLRMVFAHEIGHFLGLSHSDDQSALMAREGKLTPDLTPDDEAGVCAIYPPGKAALECTAPPSAAGAECHGAKRSCPEAEESGCGCELPGVRGYWSAWALVLLTLAAGRRWLRVRLGRNRRRLFVGGDARRQVEQHEDQRLLLRSEIRGGAAVRVRFVRRRRVAG